MAFADIRYWVRAHAARTLRSCTLLAVAGILTLAFPQITRGQDIRTQEILFDDNAATTATRHTLTLRGPLDDSLTIDYSLLLPSQSGIGIGALLFVDSWGANTGTTRWLTSTPNAVLTTDASGNPVWGTVSSLITSAGEFADADTIGLDGFVYARQALENGTPDTVVVTDGGAFGIGTTTPDGWITVQGNNDLFRAKDASGTLKSVLTDEGEQNWYLGNPAGDFGQGRIGTILSYPAFSLLRPGSSDQFNILNRSSYTALGYSSDGSDTGSVLNIAQGGNVGIGTPTPQNRLHIVATSDPIRLEGVQQTVGLDSVMVLDAQGVVQWAPADSLIRYWIDSAFVSADAWLLEGNSGTNAAINFLGTTDSVDLVFRTNSTEAGRVTAGGNLGLGTPAPQNRLHVSATSDPIRIDGLQQVFGLDSVMVLDAQGVVHWAPADSLIRYWIDSAFVDNPAWLLEGNSGTDAAINFLGTTDSVDLVFRTNSTEAGRITADGNVGLGIAAPQNQLHVAATSDPLRLDGVQQVFGLDSVMVLDAQGVVHWAPADSLIRYWIDSAVVTPNAWLLDGNAGTSPAINYVGTSDLQNLSIRANAVEHIELDATTGETNVTNAPAAGGSWNTLNTTLDMSAGGALSGGGVNNNSLLLGGGGSTGTVSVITSDATIQSAGIFANLYGNRSTLSFPNLLATTVSSYSGSSVELPNGGAASTIANFYGYRTQMTGNPTILGGWGMHVGSPGTNTSNFTGVEVEDLGNVSGTARALYYDGVGTNDPFVVTGAGDVGVGTATPSQAVEVLDGNILLSNTGSAGQVRFAEPSGSGTNFSSFQAQAQPATINYLLPDTAGAAGDVLTVRNIAGTTVTLDWGAGVPNAWLLEGNSGTTAGTNFLGTIDNEPMEIKVNSERVMRYIPSSVSPSILGGYSGNTIAAGEDGNVIAGGGAAGLVNEIGTGVDFSLVGGGRDNEILSSSQLAFVGGGEQNSVNTSSNYSLVVGGFDNEVTGTTYGSILGGRNNTLSSGATNSAIVGGRGLTLQGRGSLGFLGGNSGSRNMTVADSNIVLFGNADLWLTNNDSSASAARFYEPNSTTGSFPTTVNYTSLKAQAQAANIEYVFPDTAGVVDDVLTVRSTSGTEVVLDWRQSNEIEGVGRLLFARKTSNETVTVGATAALQNDDELYLPLGANRTYEISGALYIKRSSGVGSFDIGFDVPANSIMLISFFANESKSGNSNTGADIRDVDATGALANSTNYKLVGINTNWNVIHFKGLIVTGNTSGNVNLMWSPDGGAATVYTNSYIGAKVAEN